MTTDDPDHLELADLIHEFLSVALAPESRPEIEATAREVGGSFEQFLTMSLTHLITERYTISPKPGTEPGDS